MTGIVIVGAGPVGTLLAAELARRGVAARLLERRPAAGAGSRAVGIHATTLAALEASGVTERLLATARRVREGEARHRGRTLGVVRFDRLDTRHPYVATLPQSATEAALAGAAGAWGAAAPERGAEVTGIRPGRGGAHVLRADADPLEATVVVLAGGGRSRALHPAGARTHAYPDRYLMTDGPDAGSDGDRAVVHLDPDGVLESFPLPGGARRYVAWVRAGGDESGEAAAERLRRAVARRTGSDAAAAALTSATAFGVRRALVSSLRSGPVVAIGDAAHEVSPIGGQGMNLGLIDAVTLAPLLAQWARDGEAPPELDRWDRSRRRAAALSARIAAVNTRLGRPSPARVRPVAVRLALRSPAERLLARAYAMDFDPTAAALRPR
ncbi:FAD-dependent monooxygenase [Microbacterium sp. W1N]|uniref:FAD-dependent oxidoreductase n=1 Tax=Microbacterium festucae TaxID=2977531 RepID=UPI0021BFAC91|nr:NAD(P)/FAD-dependent oxidoreductase [Microbacterium festucae]MCT9819635.1 FAD-dependent monooxygenase [Microbacterium festucae]